VQTIFKLNLLCQKNKIQSLTTRTRVNNSSLQQDPTRAT